MNITKAQAAYVTVYQPGDVLVPTQNYKKQGLLKGQQYTVVSVDRENQRLLVETPGGQVMGVDPGRCPLKSVYVGQKFQVAPGDQLRWTKMIGLINDVMASDLRSSILVLMASLRLLIAKGIRSNSISAVGNMWTMHG